MIQSTSVRPTPSDNFPILISPQVQDVCDYIENAYVRCYEADITCRYQHFLVAVDGQGKQVAAVGYRTPDSAFFLEQYLNESAEDVLSAVYGETIGRSSIVEIGNLVGDDSRAVFFLMQGLWNHLYQRQYRHALLTCTRNLKRRFKHLPMHHLAIACKQRVSDPECWGSYYQESPEVMTGRLQEYDQRFNRVAHAGELIVHYVTNTESFQ